VIPALLIALLALLAAGCGEREFAPDEFVDAANTEGAGLRLGESLTSIADDVEVFAVEFADLDEQEGAGEPASHEHGGGGSLIVTGDATTAGEEFERCEATVTLTCYRAANVVLFFNAEPNDERVARVDAAIRALED
jgi:hypothetical protein